VIVLVVVMTMMMMMMTVYYALFHVTVAIASKAMHVAVTDSFFCYKCTLPVISNGVACFSRVVTIE
jgi:hypothetical protein